VKTSKQFSEMVGCALADEAALPDYLAAMDRENTYPV
jgi:hypothetical protein